MNSDNDKCGCGNYLSYGDYLAAQKVISAPMMPLSACVNCLNKNEVRIIDISKPRSQ